MIDKKEICDKLEIIQEQLLKENIIMSYQLFSGDGKIKIRLNNTQNKKKEVLVTHFEY